MGEVKDFVELLSKHLTFCDLHILFSPFPHMGRSSCCYYLVNIAIYISEWSFSNLNRLRWSAYLTKLRRQIPMSKTRLATVDCASHSRDLSSGRHSSALSLSHSRHLGFSVLAVLEALL